MSFKLDMLFTGLYFAFDYELLAVQG